MALRARRWWALYLGVYFFSWTVAVAEVRKCHPVPLEDRQLYDTWGAKQSPPLAFVRCADKCQRGLRLCQFRERPPSASERLRVATCNGRDKGPPCQLKPGRSK